MLFLEYGPDGWKELFDALTARDLDGQVLPTDAIISFEPYARACSTYLGQSVRGAVDKAAELLKPSIIDWTAFNRQMQLLSVQITDSMNLHASDTFCFAINTTRQQRVKSDLWVVLCILKHMQGLSDADTWSRLARRINMVSVTLSKKKQGIIPKEASYRIIVTDDAVYSGEQLSRFIDVLMEEARSAKNIKQVWVCPLYATTSGLKHIRRSLSPRNSNPSTSYTLLKPMTVLTRDNKSIIDALVKEDVAVQIEIDRPDGAITYYVSLFETMDIVTYYLVNTTFDCSTDFWTCKVVRQTTSSAPGIMASLNGATATVFAHKLADSLSLPHNAFLFGRTMKARLSEACLVAACDGLIPSDARVSVIRTQDLFKSKSLNKVDDSFFIDATSIKAKDTIPKTKHRRLKGMPTHIPLLQPPDACGLKKLNDETNTNWNAYFKIRETGHINKCEVPTYRSRITQRLKKLPARSKVRQFLPIS
jgi:hypothetical protein